MRERHHFLERRGERRRHRGVTANGARAIELQPRIEATKVEVVSTLGHHPQHLRLLVLAETDGARGAVVTRVPRVLQPRVRVYHALVQAQYDAVTLVVFVFFRHEYHARQNDAVGEVLAVRMTVMAVAEGAAAEVGGKKEGGEEEEEGQGDGDGVAKAEVGEVKRWWWWWWWRWRIRVRGRHGEEIEEEEEKG